MRRLLPLVVAAGIVGAVYGSTAELGFEDGHERDYWLGHSLVYARVDAINEGRGGLGTAVADASAVVRPMGVLSGMFDAALVPNMTVRLLRGTDGLPFPAAGQGLLLVLVDQRHPWGRPPAESGYTASDNCIAYLPTRNSQFSVVERLSEPAVADALHAVQRLRRNEKPQLAFDPCLVYGELRSVRRERESGAGVVVVRPKDALAGAFDAATEIEVFIDNTFLEHRFFASGANVVVWFRRRDRADRNSKEYSILLGPNSSIPADYSPICKVAGPGDPKVAEMLATFRRSTFWETHSLAYAMVVDTRSPKDDKSPGTIVLRPELTLSGRFDPAKTPELTVPTDAKILESQFHILYSGCYALVVLTRSGDSYSITADPTPFMPGDHAPICWVKSFDDRTVQDTLTAVQKLRHATDETKPKDKPGKH